MRVFLDGILRNQLNTTGEIHYEHNNYVALGADAGLYNQTDPGCPHYFRGGLDDVRVYPSALTYGQVMDDKFHCSQEPADPHRELVIENSTPSSCYGASGSVKIGPNEEELRILSFTNQTENGTWEVMIPPGSSLLVKAHDFYSQSSPDYWYIELSDENGRITRSVAFPNTNNAPVKGLCHQGMQQYSSDILTGRSDSPLRFLFSLRALHPQNRNYPRNQY